jgi:2-polyprenyl-3-methyl-5-hydroxy-6-metoxy-1,4-benzoquinol methylase
MTDPKTFWEEKILHWEEGRYNLVNSHSIMTLESVANKSSSSLRFRIEKSAELLSEFVTDKNVVEIGCGRALLARTLLDAGAKSYLGIDITDSAIGVAKELHKDLISVGKANFIQGDIRRYNFFFRAFGLVKRPGTSEFISALSRSRSFPYNFRT